ncbi:MAG: pH regulation protein F [Firmicutes bacterium HGW-Firmicutes-1]|jgi:multicomponent Na+:H+ antiporter subunit F|nr:MAG: pH regulation protein F [Firmicutes bacterium HGW-Firmicutes-1]
MISLIMFILSLLSLFLLLIIIKGPSIWDRILGYNIFSSIMILLIMLFSTLHDRSYLLDIVIVYTLLGFISIVFISRFVQGKGKI